ncbi:MAG: diadenylate cyclase CdaA [Gelidibacter sp.]|nr:diadenylate cyclase CdaA [Gelidibacter sp.]
MDFLDIRIIDIVDIVLVAFLLYYLYNLVKGTVAINILAGIIIVYAIYVVTQLLEMELLSKILGGFLGVGMFALVVVFQPEIRKFLLMLGSTNFNARRRFLKQFKFSGNDSVLNTNLEGIIASCKKMCASHTGALIVLQRNNSLDFVKNTGDAMNLEVNQPIIESIFFKNSPLHDGAIIIANNTVKATRVILPVNNEKNIPQRFGLRHRAAVGITEKTDALAIVVSEETGQISYIKNGEFTMFKDTIELTDMIQKDLV